MQLADPASTAQPAFPASDSEPRPTRWQPWRPAAKGLTRAAIVLATCLRGLVHRAGSAVIVLVVAIVAAGAAAAGPAYYQAAQSRSSPTSLAPASVPVPGRGFEVSASGAIATALPTLNSARWPETSTVISARPVVARVFSLRSTRLRQPARRGAQQDVPADLADGLLRASGHHRQLPGKGRSSDRQQREYRGDRLAHWQPDPRLWLADAHWSPASTGPQMSASTTGCCMADVLPEQGIRLACQGADLDAVFTSHATLETPRREFAAAAAGAYIDDALAVRRLRLSDVGVLQQGMTSLVASQDLRHGVRQRPVERA